MLSHMVRKDKNLMTLVGSFSISQKPQNSGNLKSHTTFELHLSSLFLQFPAFLRAITLRALYPKQYSFIYKDIWHLAYPLLMISTRLPCVYTADHMLVMSVHSRHLLQREVTQKSSGGRKKGGTEGEVAVRCWKNKREGWAQEQGQEIERETEKDCVS